LLSLEVETLDNESRSLGFVVLADTYCPSFETSGKLDTEEASSSIVNGPVGIFVASSIRRDDRRDAE